MSERTRGGGIAAGNVRRHSTSFTPPSPHHSNKFTNFSRSSNFSNRFTYNIVALRAGQKPADVVLACLHTVQEKAVEPETLIELTEEDLCQIAGGQFGAAFFSLMNSAKGGHTATVSAVVAQTTTITSATQSAIVTSFSA
jgi:hypothetical protein